MKRTTKTTEFTNVLSIQKNLPDEQACRDFFENLRWPDGKIVCPHCSETGRVSKFTDGRLYFCGACRKQFTVKVGSIFEDSALPLQKWFYAIYMMTSHKKGISSMQLSKDISVTQKTAWHMLHRIRFALAGKTRKSLDGIVEVDETFVGGKERNKHKSKRKHRGTGGMNMAPVLGMLDRDDGIVITAPVERVNARTLQGMMKSHIHADSRIMTDEWVGYNGVDQHFKSHETTSHGKGEYVRDDCHTNGIEGFWSHLKRGIIGIYHQVSVEHLHRYCSEFEYRFNTRKVKDADRFKKALGHLNGRLMYKTLINE